MFDNNLLMTANSLPEKAQRQLQDFIELLLFRYEAEIIPMEDAEFDHFFQERVDYTLLNPENGRPWRAVIAELQTSK